MATGKFQSRLFIDLPLVFLLSHFSLLGSYTPLSFLPFFFFCFLIAHIFSISLLFPLLLLISLHLFSFHFLLSFFFFTSSPLRFFPPLRSFISLLLFCSYHSCPSFSYLFHFPFYPFTPSPHLSTNHINALSSPLPSFPTFPNVFSSLPSSHSYPFLYSSFPSSSSITFPPFLFTASSLIFSIDIYLSRISCSNPSPPSIPPSLSFTQVFHSHTCESFTLMMIGEVIYP